MEIPLMVFLGFLVIYIPVFFISAITGSRFYFLGNTSRMITSSYVLLNILSILATLTILLI